MACKMALKRGWTRKRMSKVIGAQIEEPFAGEGDLAALGERSWIGGEIIRIQVSAQGVSDLVERRV